MWFRSVLAEHDLAKFPLNSTRYVTSLKKMCRHTLTFISIKNCGILTATVVDECELLAIHNTFWTRVKTSLFFCWIHRETQRLGHMLLHLNTNNTVVKPIYESWRHRWSGENIKVVHLYFLFSNLRIRQFETSLFRRVYHDNTRLTMDSPRVLSRWNRPSPVRVCY